MGCCLLHDTYALAFGLRFFILDLSKNSHLLSLSGRSGASEYYAPFCARFQPGPQLVGGQRLHVRYGRPGIFGLSGSIAVCRLFARRDVIPISSTVKLLHGGECNRRNS